MTMSTNPHTISELASSLSSVIEKRSDEKEWERIRRPSTIRAARKSTELEEARRTLASVDEHHDVQKMGTIKES
jgi:hypothetical protein